MLVSEDVSGMGDGGKAFLILEFSIQYHHLHICIYTSDLDKVAGRHSHTHYCRLVQFVGNSVVSQKLLVELLSNSKCIHNEKLNSD